jgi:RNA polymerase sigma-70 factor (ECF subfamily)
MPPQHARTLDPLAAARHRSRLVDLASAMCGSRHLAEDLTQETYARVLAKPRRLRDDADFPYLVRTLRNVITDHWRTERRRPLVVGEIDTEQPSRGDRDPETAIYASEVYTAVAGLPREFRHVVTAVDVVGLSYSQAASQLRIPLGTVMSRLSRGRSRLAGALA